MALGKMLNLGGIDNRPPKANQSMGRFRVARNVMPTPNDTLIPRYDWETPSSQPADSRCIHHIANYDSEPLVLVSEDLASTGITTETYGAYLANTAIPQWSDLGISPLQSGAEYSQLPQSYRVNNTVYSLLPKTGNLIKYDGVEMGAAGCPQPIFSVSTADLTGSRYVRVVAHTIDFDNNEPVSDFVQFTTGAAATIQFSGGVPGTYTQLPAVYTGVSPSTRIANNLDEANYYVASAVSYSAGEFAVTTADTNITSQSRVGSYVFVSPDAATSAVILGALYANTLIYGIALQVKSVSPLVLDATTAYLMNTSREWEIVDLSSIGATVASGLQILGVGSRYFLSYWESVASTGIYYARGVSPWVPKSTNTAVLTRYGVTTTGTAVSTYNTTQSMFLIAPALNDWYDVTSVKLSPNAEYPFGDTAFFSMTKFQNMLLLANDQYIFLSDTTLGGWVEQLNAGSFILVGDKEFGRITSICGTNDFLFVGRERKNYYVTGNITTGNYRVMEIPEAEVGPWCNNSTINVKDSVIFITALGIFQTMAGGKTVKLSDKCPKNFEDYNNLNKAEDVSFEMSGFHSEVGSSATIASKAGLAVAYDEYRELLVWMKRASGNAAIVVHTKTGEIYEWDGLLTGYDNVFANCIQFIEAKYYLGMIDQNLAPYSTTAQYVKENYTLIRTYPITHPVKLYSTWLTAGEPSLEKEVLQLKLFGRVDTTASVGLKVRHYKDWDISTLITDTTYYPNSLTLSINNQVQFSHKKRLTSDKCLAASVGVEITGADVDFEIESFEVEFNPIQTGMKR